MTRLGRRFLLTKSCLGCLVVAVILVVMLVVILVVLVATAVGKVVVLVGLVVMVVRAVLMAMASAVAVVVVVVVVVVMVVMRAARARLPAVRFQIRRPGLTARCPRLYLRAAITPPRCVCCALWSFATMLLITTAAVLRMWGVAAKASRWPRQHCRVTGASGLTL
jgi:hypothetical protein